MPQDKEHLAGAPGASSSFALYFAGAVIESMFREQDRLWKWQVAATMIIRWCTFDLVLLMN